MVISQKQPKSPIAKPLDVRVNGIGVGCGFETRGELTVFIARMIPGVRGFISIPAGIARMNVVRFSIFTFIGAFPWTLGLAWGGYLLGENYDAIRDVSKPFDIPIIGTVTVIVIWFLCRRIREVRAEGATLGE